MPASKSAPQPQQEPLPQLAYPVIESFVEHATAEDVNALFSKVRDGLTTLKGPRADQAKKITVAIERTEELLGQLLAVREKLLAEGKGPKRR